MGKGDPKSKKGKIFKGSYGNTRKREDQKRDNSSAPKAEKKA